MTLYSNKGKNVWFQALFLTFSFFATVFFVIFSSHAGATEIKAEKSADLNSSANCCCSDNNSDPGSSARSKAKHDSVGSFKPLRRPGPKYRKVPKVPKVVLPVQEP